MNNDVLYNQMVKPAKRDNNKLRSYLIVNPCLCKHIPACPHVLMEKAEQLSNKLLENITGSSILVIAFSETATAVGAACAYYLHKNNQVYFITTTRENYDNEEYIDFSEVHSHAAAQKLYTKNLHNIINNIKHIVFIEDEITTGNTIINLYNALNKKFKFENINFWTLSLINGMKQENLDNFKNHNITPLFLLKTNNDNIGQHIDNINENGEKYDSSLESNIINIINLKGYLNPRFVTNYEDYYTKLIDLYDKIKHNINNSNILILGTEECMFAGILFGFKLGGNILFHATTRSPIVPAKYDEYPLFSRYSLESFYEKNRVTYIYNLKKYDNIYIVTDSIYNNDGINSLINALKIKDNKNITIINLGG